MKSYSPYQFSFFRIILGTYLVIHFSYLIPYASEIWSSVGILPDPSSNLTYGVFPNILYYNTSSFGVTLYVLILTILSVLFIIGYQRPTVSILLWYGWATLFDRNNLINNPGIPYIGWLLLVSAVIPKGEPLSLSRSSNHTKWKMPFIIIIGAWALMSIGYTISGIDKFFSPSWRDGSAIFHLLENPLARDSWIREILLKSPMSILNINTWAVLSIEMIFLPLALFKGTRKWIWLAMVFIHLGILVIVDFADLTFGMLMIHWFTFDSEWIKSKSKHSGILFFDGVCGICNNFIDFMITEDRNETIQYTPLQGNTAEQLLDPNYLHNLITIVYKEDEYIYTESDAVIHSMSALGGMYKIVLFFKLIPKAIRDKIYRFISSHRYKWFGKRDACRIPLLEERSRFLN